SAPRAARAWMHVAGCVRGCPAVSTKTARRTGTRARLAGARLKGCTLPQLESRTSQGKSRKRENRDEMASGGNRKRGSARWKILRRVAGKQPVTYIEPVGHRDRKHQDQGAKKCGSS